MRQYFFVAAIISALLCIIAFSTVAEAAVPSSLKGFFAKFSKATPIPGLTSSWTPQGLAYYKSKDWMLTSHYWGGSGEHASRLGVVLRGTNKQVKMLQLKYRTSSGAVKALTGHVGGIAVSKKHLWVASEEGKSNPYSLYRYTLSDVVFAKDGAAIIAKKSHPLVHTASYATYYDGTLWVGTYTHGKDLCDPSPNRKGKVYAYKLNADDLLTETEPMPKSIWTTPDRIQGMAMTKDRVLYAQSCGRTNNSTLFVFSKGTSGSKKKSIVASPMAEGMTIIDNQLYMLFESGSSSYVKGGKMVLKNTYKTNLSNIL